MKTKNRTIKFRAWNKKHEVMTDRSFDFTAFDGNCFCDWGSIPLKPEEAHNLWYLEDMEIMQYTGITDKNGQEIYEGDILHMEGSYLNREIYKNVEVVWRERGCWNIGAPWGYDGESPLKMYECEVIGNKFENPNLLDHEN